MSIGFGMKSKMNLMGEEIESPNGRVTSYTSKGNIELKLKN